MHVTRQHCTQVPTTVPFLDRSSSNPLLVRSICRQEVAFQELWPARILYGAYRASAGDVLR
jgi:hypothetical protein